LAIVSVVQRDWAAKNPRATFRTPLTVEDVPELSDDRLPVLEVVRRLGRRAHAQ